MKKKIERFLINKIPNIKNKTIFIVGGTGELGEYVIKYLLFLGANLILGVRNIEKGNRLKEKYNNENISLIYLDFNNINSIITCAKKLKEKNIDYIIINSGIDDKSFNLIGHINSNLLINCYGPYFFMKCLGNKVPIIVTGSISYKRVKNKDKYKRKDSYAYSKRILLQLCYLLRSKQFFNITLVHPGISVTQLFIQRHKYIKFLIPILKLCLMKKEYAALNIIYGLNQNTNPKEWIGPGGLFEIYGLPEVRKLKKEIFNSEILNKLDMKIKKIDAKMEENYEF